MYRNNIFRTDMFWNAMTAHIIIKQAQIRGVGVATVHEVFNEIMADIRIEPDKMREICKLPTRTNPVRTVTLPCVCSQNPAITRGWCGHCQTWQHVPNYGDSSAS